LEKLLEESREVMNAKNREEVVKELADVLEVCDALLVQYGISREEISAIKEQKKRERGGFEKRIILDHA
jgi:predicted house-cleaning noncanonical NTP pyrophosphatase (MazG superfamily)